MELFLIALNVLALLAVWFIPSVWKWTGANWETAGLIGGALTVGTAAALIWFRSGPEPEWADAATVFALLFLIFSAISWAITINRAYKGQRSKKKLK